jgi:hypothetical protein
MPILPSQDDDFRDFNDGVSRYREQAALDAIGAEPLLGSGFESETPEPGYGA